jgi:hypothetical protein
LRISIARFNWTSVVGSVGLVTALRRSLNDEFAEAFSAVQWTAEPAAEGEGDLARATRLYGRAVALSHPADPVSLLASGRIGALSGAL